MLWQTSYFFAYAQLQIKIYQAAKFNDFGS